jgi:hypothetical protein
MQKSVVASRVLFLLLSAASVASAQYVPTPNSKPGNGLNGMTPGKSLVQNINNAPSVVPQVTPLIANASLNGAVNAMAAPYGAKCDGATDDSGAINTAATAAQGVATLYFPENRTCAVASEITLHMANGPVEIRGGKNSVLLLTDTSNKGLHFTGTGVTANDLVLKGLAIKSSTSEPLRHSSTWTELHISNCTTCR